MTSLRLLGASLLLLGALSAFAVSTPSDVNGSRELAAGQLHQRTRVSNFYRAASKHAAHSHRCGKACSAKAN